MDLQPQVPIGRVHTADEATLGIANAANKAYLLNQSRINESDISHTHTNNEAGMHDGPGRQDRGDLKRRSVSEKEFSGVEEADERDIRKRQVQPSPLTATSTLIHEQDFHGKYLFWYDHIQVPKTLNTMGSLANTCDHLQASLPVHRCHLRRHRHLPSLRLLLHLQLRP